MGAITLLQILPKLDGGGVERGTLEVAQEAVARGYRSLVVSEGGRLLPTLLENGSEHWQWPIGAKSPLTLRYISTLRQHFNQGTIDLVHVRSRLPAWITYFAWKLSNPKKRPRWVNTVHGLYSVNPYSAIMTQAESVIAVSKTTENYLTNHYSIDPQKITVIPRGIDPEFFSPTFQPSPAWINQFSQTLPLGSRKYLCLPARVTPRKGHPDFIRLIHQLLQKGYPVHGIMVGSNQTHPRYQQELGKLITQLKVSNHISFLGDRSDIREIYSVSAMILSLSSRPESFGRTVVEALSLGRPVLGYSHGGVAENLERFYPQGAVPFNRSDILLEKAEFLLNQPQTLTPQNLPTTREMLNRTFELYEHLLNHRK